MKRNAVLADAGMKINGDRARDYGAAYENHSRIGQMWGAILGVDISPSQVAMMMIALKLSRLTNRPDHLDSWVDVCGYAALGGEFCDDAEEESPA
jgi:hypothetical protein